jgi:hypothetical protein
MWPAGCQKVLEVTLDPCFPIPTISKSRNAQGLVRRPLTHASTLPTTACFIRTTFSSVHHTLEHTDFHALGPFQGEYIIVQGTRYKECSRRKLPIIISKEKSKRTIYTSSTHTQTKLRRIKTNDQHKVHKTKAFPPVLLPRNQSHAYQTEDPSPPTSA